MAATPALAPATAAMASATAMAPTTPAVAVATEEDDPMPRLVYSLLFETERKPGEPIIGFVVPLDRAGNSPPSVRSVSRASWTCAPATSSSMAQRETV